MDVKEKVWISLDVSLGIVALLLLISLLGAEIPSLGKVYAQNYPGDSQCLTGPEFGLTPLDPERCCFEAMRLLYSEKNVAIDDNANEGVNLVVDDGIDSDVDNRVNEKRYDYHFFNPDGPSIVMNTKAYLECQQKEYWVEKKRR